MRDAATAATASGARPGAARGQKKFNKFSFRPAFGSLAGDCFKFVSSP
jgi:hypothetical protein